MLMDDVRQKIIHGLILWGIAILGAMFLNRKKASAGLTYIWLGDLAINHLFGALIYLVPDYVPEAVFLKDFTAESTAEGFFLTSLGLMGFLAGTICVGPLLSRFMKPNTESAQRRFSPRLPVQLIICGWFFYFVLQFLQGIPSLGTLSQAGWMLMQVGICLAARGAYLQNRKIDFLLWLAAGLIFFPCFTLFYKGFLSFGIKVMLIILCFTSIYYRHKWRLFALTPLFLWLGLTLFINYFNARESIREAVWGGGQLKDRVEAVQTAFANPQGFSIHNVQHLDFINGRLNQNSLVGIGAEYLSSGQKEFARGKTIWDAVLAVIPRILWKNKPIVGGSGSIVSDYTGLTFSEGTSVGVGLPLELYVNFGTMGIVAGCFIVGAFLRIYDRKAGEAIRREDIKTFLLFFLPGLAFTSTLGSLMEATSSFAAMYVFLFIINRFIFKWSKRTSKYNAQFVDTVQKHLKG